MTSKLNGLTVAALVGLAASGPAAAQQASAQGAAAIAAKRQSLREPVLGYFTTAAGGGPVATAQNGAYQFFSGPSGRGMILWKPAANGRPTSAYVVYGPILTYFLAQGRETGLLGFPSGDPEPGDDEGGCSAYPSTTQNQVFNGSLPASQGGRLRFTTLCAQPNGAVYEGLVIQ